MSPSRNPLRSVVGLAIAAGIAGSLTTAWALATPGPIQGAAVSWAATKLERRFSAPTLSDVRPVTGIVVLGGNTSRARAAIELAHRHPDALVILSGPDLAEIDVMLADSHVTPRLVVDRRPRTTFENAVYSKSIAAPKPGERWLLVTSGIHMPRSVGAFRAVGFDAEPWPLRDIPVRSPDAKTLVRHELMGLAYYRLLGRSVSLFPGPLS